MIYLSAGHNPLGPNPDPGACANGLREADLTIEFRNMVAKELLQMNASFTVDKDTERLAQYVGRLHPGTGSVVCEFHLNAGPITATGVETIVRRKATITEKALAEDINKAVVKHTGLLSRGVKDEGQSQHSRLAILNTGAGISVLPELCFITSKTDVAQYNRGKKALAYDIAFLLFKADAMFT